MNSLKNFKTHIDGRDVLIATLDVPGRPLNVLDDLVLHDLNEITDYAGSDAGKTLKMIVFRSGKPGGFLAGADILRIKEIRTREECQWILEQGQGLFNKLEKLKVPTLAVIHGACVGGGLELALACRYRVAVNSESTRLGLPEVKLGLIPAWGGTQRLPRTVGLSMALPMLLQGKLLTAHEAHRSGLVDRLIDPNQVDEEVDGFIDRRLDGVPIAPRNRTVAQWLVDSNPIGRSLALKQARKGIEKPAQHYPALARILDAVDIGVHSKTLSEAGLSAERSAFCDLLFGNVAPNLIDLFLNQERAKKTATWTGDVEGLPVKKIAVIGAGTMGAGIAQLAASRGISVILQDVKEEFVHRGMDTIRGLFSKAIKKGAIEKGKAELALESIQPRVDWAPSDNVDLMIEAIVERLDAKQSLFDKADDELPLHAFLASNTSALPIDKMAEVTRRSTKVGGLHFFNPVHKMPLIEVVRAPQTSDETIATLVGVAKQLGKTPIVVNQSPGFLVNRILFPYLDEAARLVTEGFAIEEIDREAKKFGMPMGPLELLDIVGLDVVLDVAGTLSPLAAESSPSLGLFADLVREGRKGQKTGRGFYQWLHGKRTQALTVPVEQHTSGKVLLGDWTIEGETFGTIQQRLVLAMINETQKCIVEGVVKEPWMADLGMVLGTGFAPFRGGPMACLKYWGKEHVKARLELLASVCGPRFTPAPEIPSGNDAQQQLVHHGDHP